MTDIQLKEQKIAHSTPGESSATPPDVLSISVFGGMSLALRGPGHQDQEPQVTGGAGVPRPQRAPAGDPRASGRAVLERIRGAQGARLAAPDAARAATGLVRGRLSRAADRKACNRDRPEAGGGRSLGGDPRGRAAPRASAAAQCACAPPRACSPDSRTSIRNFAAGCSPSARRSRTGWCAASRPDSPTTASSRASGNCWPRRSSISIRRTRKHAAG